VAENTAAVGGSRWPTRSRSAAADAVAATAVWVKDLLYRTALAPGVSFTGPLLLVDNTIHTRRDSDRACIVGRCGSSMINLDEALQSRVSTEYCLPNDQHR
jgi:hypothetical protein